MQWLVPEVALFSCFRTFHPVFGSGSTSLIPTRNERGFHFLNILPYICCFWPFYFIHSELYMWDLSVVSFVFPWWQLLWIIFSSASWPFVSLFWRKACSCILPISWLDWLFCWELNLWRKYLVLFCRLPFVLLPVALLYRFYLDEVLTVYFSLCFLCLLRDAFLEVTETEDKKMLPEFASRIWMNFSLRFQYFIILRLSLCFV